MKSYIVGISGQLNSGKDTFASMLNYIFYKGVAKANYSDWLTHRVKWDLTNEHRITHFADPMKDCLSIIYNIPRKYFDDRDKKDVEWYSFSQRRFLTEAEASFSEYVGITIESLTVKYNLNYIIEDIERKGKTPVIRLRTLMQYFGTEIGRKLLGNNLWINSTMYRAADIAETTGLCIIPDVRYRNENNAIVKHILYGGDIEIRRESTDQVAKHDSEDIDFKSTFPIQNNGTKMQLFYKAVGFANHMLKCY